jgi:hypothetical protein
MKIHEPGYSLVKKVPKGAQRKQRKDAGVIKKTVSESFLQTSLPVVACKSEFAKCLDEEMSANDE